MQIQKSAAVLASKGFLKHTSDPREGDVYALKESIEERKRDDKYVMHNGIQKRVVSREEWKKKHKDFKNLKSMAFGNKPTRTMMGLGRDGGNFLEPVYVEGLDKGGIPESIEGGSDQVKTKWSPPEGFFTRPAEDVAARKFPKETYTESLGEGRMRDLAIEAEEKLARMGITSKQI